MPQPLIPLYRVIGFGSNSHGFFNNFSFARTEEEARVYYRNHLHDPEIDGAVIVRIVSEDWQVVDEFGTDGVSVIYTSGSGSHKVVKT